ncbi:MAG TPA: ABC transporter ATP-binding protein [Bacteroidales bacterium]|nr:ABC transporter ATP-binding protein [Bacteroidales bacterium]HPT20547.1 ABC transporter ATP-binding protein [Bacteroidales bacterium]
MTISARLSAAGKTYVTGDSSVIALQPTTVEFRKNELTLIVGPSGSGKTTLLSLLGCVIYPTTGDVWIEDECVNNLSENELAEIRLNKIGFVFQGFNLLAPLSGLENVMQPLLMQGVSHKEARSKALALLNEFGLGDRIKNLPRNLSGGQQQRIAIARALITNPGLILCDEPTASLDHKSTLQVMDNLCALKQKECAVIIVTHDMRLRKYADRTIYVTDGSICESSAGENPDN